jgi:hypothetical protein
MDVLLVDSHGESRLNMDPLVRLPSDSLPGNGRRALRGMGAQSIQDMRFLGGMLLASVVARDQDGVTAAIEALPAVGGQLGGSRQAMHVRIGETVAEFILGCRQNVPSTFVALDG